MDIKISPEQLDEHSNSIIKLSEAIDEKINDISKIIQSLNGWQSNTKEMFVQKLEASLVEMGKISESARSYGLVGHDVATRVSNVEASISESIMNDLDA